MADNIIFVPRPGQTDHQPLVEEATTILVEACAILQSRIEAMNSDLAYGAYRMLKTIAAEINETGEDASASALSDLSAQCAAMLAVLDMYACKANDIPAWAAYRLVGLGKSLIDIKMDAVEAEEAAASRRAAA